MGGTLIFSRPINLETGEPYTSDEIERLHKTGCGQDVSEVIRCFQYDIDMTDKDIKIIEAEATKYAKKIYEARESLERLEEKVRDEFEMYMIEHGYHKNMMMLSKHRWE